MSDQYSVLGKAPGIEDLKKLSSSGNTHLTINNLNVVMEKWKFYIILIFMLVKRNHFV